MNIVKQINNLRIVDTTFQNTGIPHFRGLVYAIKTPDNRILEEFKNLKGDKGADALVRAENFCKETKDFIN